MTNLAADPALASVVREHRLLLRRHCEQMQDEFGLSLLAGISEASARASFKITA